MSIQKSANNLLVQLDSVLSQITDDQYTESLEVLSDASLGQHIRHTLEFFVCLIDGRNHNEINYDLRKRDLIIESNRMFARSLIESICDFLSEQNSDFQLVFKANYGIEEEENIEIHSTFLRELAYNIEHAIHHMALIKIGIKSINKEITLPEHFGVASSTVRFQLKQG